MKKKLVVTDKSPREIVVSIANSLEVSFQEYKRECSMKLPEEFGKGTVVGYTFEKGFGVVRTQYILKKDFHFNLSRDAVHNLKLIFNIGDTFNHKLERDENYRDLNFSEVMIAASVPTNNHNFVIPSKVRCDIFSIEINRKLFEEKTIEYIDEMDLKLANLFRDVNGVLPFTYKGSYTYDIGNLIEEFSTCELKGFERSIFLEAKAYEILSKFLAQYIDDIQKPDKRNIFRQNQIRNIKEAGTFIKENLEGLPTVQLLSKQFGLSKNIFQNGFKSIYGLTVNEFIQKERLRTAKQLLEESDYSISEITYLVGLTSKSYLSKIFMDQYNMTPTDFRSKNKGTRDGTN